MSDLDLRGNHRVPVALDVQCRIGGRRFQATIRDLSGQGCFIGTEERARLEVAIELVFQPPGFVAPVRVRGEIIRVAGGRDDHIGLGVEFLSPLADAPLAEAPAVASGSPTP